MAWLHPVLGITAVLLVAWMAMAGLRSRQRDPYAPQARRLHRRYAPLAGLLVVLAALAGTTSVGLLRQDMDLGQTWHFRVGWTAATLSVLTWLSSRRIHQQPRLKRVHPWLGLLLLAACATVALLGLDLLP